MRRILHKITQNEIYQPRLADPSVVDSLVKGKL